MSTIRLVPIAAVIAALALGAPAEAKTKRVTVTPAQVQAVQAAVQQAVAALPPAVVQQIVPIVKDAVAEAKPIVEAAKAAERPLTPSDVAALREIRSDARDAINDVLTSNDLPKLPVRPERVRPE
jgi:peptidoglycan hydrolase-like amidase